MIEFGLYSFAEIDPTSDKAITGKQRIDQLLEEIKLAESRWAWIYMVVRASSWITSSCPNRNFRATLVSN